MRQSPHPFHGPTVEKLRDAAGYTAWQFAKKVGISGTHMRRLELGERGPSPDVRNRIAAALGVSLEDLSPTAKAA